MKDHEEAVRDPSSDLYQLHRSYNITALMNQKKTNDSSSYQQILFKFLKLVEYELASQNDLQPIIVIPLDFLTLLNI